MCDKVSGQVGGAAVADDDDGAPGVAWARAVATAARNTVAMAAAQLMLMLGMAYSYASRVCWSR